MRFLIAEIIKAAQTREEELDAGWWTEQKVDKCLANLNQKDKIAARALAAAANQDPFGQMETTNGE